MGKSKPQTATTEKDPWKPSQEYLKDIMSQNKDWFKTAQDTGYISATGDLNPIYQQYLSALQGTGDQIKSQMDPLLQQGSNSLNQFSQFNQDALNGKYGYTNDQVVQGANSYINNDLLTAQIKAATQDDVRNFTENTMPQNTLDALGTGNLNSSRGAIMDAVAKRGLDDRVANVSANMRGQAYQNGLNMSNQNVLNNLQTQLGAGNNIGNISNMYMTNAGNMGNLMNQYNNVQGLGQIADINAQIQGHKQGDLIGDRDYMGQLISQYANIPITIGGMGGTQTQTQSGGGGSTFGKIAGVGMAGLGAYMSGGTSLMGQGVGAGLTAGSGMMR